MCTCFKSSGALIIVGIRAIIYIFFSASICILVAGLFLLLVSIGLCFHRNKVLMLIPNCFDCSFNDFIKSSNSSLVHLHIPIPSSMNRLQNIISSHPFITGFIFWNSNHCKKISAICLELHPPVGIPTLALKLLPLYVTNASCSMNSANFFFSIFIFLEN